MSIYNNVVCLIIIIIWWIFFPHPWKDENQKAKK